jgi:hypothetical protein
MSQKTLNKKLGEFFTSKGLSISSDRVDYAIHLIDVYRTELLSLLDSTPTKVGKQIEFETLDSTKPKQKPNNVIEFETEILKGSVDTWNIDEPLILNLQLKTKDMNFIPIMNILNKKIIITLVPLEPEKSIRPAQPKIQNQIPEDANCKNCASNLD